jgi:hypothetical protein
MRKTRLVLGVAIIGAVLAAAVPANAQTQAKSEGEWFLGVTGGVSAVQNVGGAFGGEIGTKVTSKVLVFGEGLVVTDTATRRRIQTAQSVAAVLQQTQGVTATATLTAPATSFMGGLRLMIHDGGSFKLFVEGMGGMARVVYKPVFLLNGADVTAQLSQFGVTLGSDLTGTANKAAFGGGLGLEVRHNVWYITGKFGVMSIQTPSQPSNVIRATATIGRWF